MQFRSTSKNNFPLTHKLLCQYYLLSHVKVNITRINQKPYWLCPLKDKTQPWRFKGCEFFPLFLIISTFFKKCIKYTIIVENSKNTQQSRGNWKYDLWFYHSETITIYSLVNFLLSLFLCTYIRQIHLS